MANWQVKTMAYYDEYIDSISYVLVSGKATVRLKNRLFQQMSKAGACEPLLVDSNSEDSKGLKSHSAELTRAAELYKDTPEKLWWHLLSAAIDSSETSTDELARLFSQQMEQPTSDDPILRIFEKIEGKTKRTFLIDDIETAFNAKLILTYTEALFRFIQTVETDPTLSKYIHLKLFISSDLVGRILQNIKQQLRGKTLYI